MRLALGALLCGFACHVSAADIYRWVDGRGVVHYSNAAPPAEATAARIDLDAPASMPGTACTARCQDERLEERLEWRHRMDEARLAVRQEAKGLDVASRSLIRTGMSESELIAVAGNPDLRVWDWRSVKTFAYGPTPQDPYTTAILLVDGRVSEIERLRRF